MIDSTLLIIIAAFGFLFIGVGAVRKEQVWAFGAGTIFLVLGLLLLTQGIGQTQSINVSIANATGVISQWSNSTTTFQASPAENNLLGFSFLGLGLFLFLVEAIYFTTDAETAFRKRWG